MNTAALVVDTDVGTGRRFGGVSRLYGPEGARRFAQAHVVAVGVGGVGSWAVEALARSGIGRLTLIDLDHVAESNINRQVQALDTTLGQAKVQALRERIAAIHPAARIDCIEEFVDPENVASLIPEQAQIVLDCCDQVRAKVALATLALQRRQPLLMAGAAGGKRHPENLHLSDLSGVTHDPLLAKVRYQLRRTGAAQRSGRIGIPCVHSAEPVAPPLREDAADACAPVDGGLNCAGFGSSVMVTATMGMTLAARALDALLPSTPKAR